MIKIYLVLLFTTHLFGITLLDIYKDNGIASVEKQLDYELMNKDFWDKYLKNKDLSFGYIEQYNSILTCDKESSKLNLYKKSNNHFKLKKDYSAFTGKYKGDKIKEGDRRTPLGVYTLTKIIDKLDAFYGPLAFVTSYPNIYDKYKGKNGSGIWIHGLPEDEKREKYTKGCIAIDNNNIKNLNKDIDIKNTILIINPNKNFKHATKENIATILSELYRWRYSWIYNDVEQYLDFYSDDFIKSNGARVESFKKYKRRIFSKNESKSIVFKNINIIPYPNTKNTYQVRFTEFYKSTSLEFVGDKILMIKLENNTIKIFTEN